MHSRTVPLLGVGLLLALGLSYACAGTFPDAHDEPPEGWTGPVFKLRQNYPKNPPPVEAYPWKKFDFKKQPLDYLRSVLKYCYEGNLDLDWQVEKNGVRDWYHAPWLHAGQAGREFIHGLTRERRSQPKELHPQQTDAFQNWAVSVYNSPGGYVIGRVWKDSNAPDPTVAVFPDGTVSIKLLFTQATVDQVPFLKNSHEWQADINRDALPDASNVPKLRLLQIDLAVREARADDITGWVFGTFLYNGEASGKTDWERMIPVGLMWGNDPLVTPAMVAAGTTLQQTFINDEVRPLMQHFGWAGRLNGPVDNALSSCLSCHSTAQYPQGRDVVPSGSDSQRLRWFRNIKAGQPFDVDGDHQSLDYSLQLAFGIQRFDESRGNVEAAKIAGQQMVFTKQGKRIFAVSREGKAEPEIAFGRGTEQAKPLEHQPNAPGPPVSLGQLIALLILALFMGAVLGWFLKRLASKPKPAA